MTASLMSKPIAGLGRGRYPTYRGGLSRGWGEGSRPSLRAPWCEFVGGLCPSLRDLSRGLGGGCGVRHAGPYCLDKTVEKW